MTHLPKRFESPPGLIWRDTTGLRKFTDAPLAAGITHEWQAQVGESSITLSRFCKENRYFIHFSHSPKLIPGVVAETPEEAAAEAFERCALIVSNLDEAFIALRPKDDRVPARIRITRCEGNWWYRNRIGEVFDVKKVNKNGDFNVGGIGDTVFKEDAEVVEYRT